MAYEILLYEKKFLRSSGRPVNMRFAFTKFIPLMADIISHKGSARRKAAEN
jgi:hypothetical protein